MLISNYTDGNGRKIIFTKCRSCGRDISVDTKLNFLHSICDECDKELKILPEKLYGSYKEYKNLNDFMTGGFV